jgi:mutual gliding-motility protein MglA
LSISTRKLVLRGADGVVFVADSLEVRREQNMLALKDLQQNLKDYQLSIFRIPLVMQFNKRDLEEARIALMGLDQMQQELNRQLKVPAFPAAALKGAGVGRTLQECLRLVLRSLQQELNF